MIMNSLLGLLWLNFIFLWNLVNRVTGLAEAVHSFSYLGGMIAVYSVLLAGWVYHNIQIWRKKGPRLGLRRVSEAVKRDVLSRHILPSVDLKGTQDIAVNVRGDKKVFASAPSGSTG